MPTLKSYAPLSLPRALGLEREKGLVSDRATSNQKDVNFPSEGESDVARYTQKVSMVLSCQGGTTAGHG